MSFLKASKYFITIFLLVDISTSVIPVEGTNYKRSPSEDIIDDDSAYVVADLEVIYGCHGVEIKRWYMESSPENSDVVVSSPGCPKSIEGHPWLYYGDPPKCFLAGHHGPCPLGEKLLIKNKSNYGICACDCLFDHSYSEELMDENQRYVHCVRNTDSVPPPNEQFYDKQESKCYYKFERGPCAEGAVLVNVTKTDLKCLPPCDETKEGWELEEVRGLCAKEKYILGVASGIGRNECPQQDEKYSELLRRCIKRFPSGSFISVGFKCSGNNNCIQKRKVCDGINDRPSGDDETHCPNNIASSSLPIATEMMIMIMVHQLQMRIISNIG